MRLFSTVVLLPLFLACVSGGSNSVLSRPTESYDHQSQVSLEDLNKTFLDSVNVGNEVPAFDSNAGAESGTAHQFSSASAENRFRIQVVAAKQLETVNEEKEKLVSGIALPVYVSYEQPYYKLLVGDFKDREDAESNLESVINLGYSDAWVVRTRVQAPE
ncbi:SPOR domain-containing protein [Chitinispirillales bacterium ANBcel5]|uniref:SPOR domain-containing protein n=1 Tax=Cellulosispirillum alkaliphilum TaxID=3039283 RepID=UPI002A527B86|nr:SPOR domain-containing protein [Chitinispirillales bacterium ANBcel5]